jgi:hypothetical protein
VSRLIGGSTDRWNLFSAQAALAQSARLAAVPSSMWVAGLCYPGLLLLFNVGWRAAFVHLTSAKESALVLFSPLFFPPLFRIIAGVARVASPMLWQSAGGARGRPRFGDAWREGRGLTWASLILWAELALLELGVISLGWAVFQAFGGTEPGAVAYLVGGPILLVFASYALVVSVLYQLAVHSLAQNRRGVVSALQHAWRLARHDPWAVARAALVDAGYSLVVFGLSWAGRHATLLLGPFHGPVDALIQVVLFGITGATRAGYWARAYRALGGVAPEDGVPGQAAQV